MDDNFDKLKEELSKLVEDILDEKAVAGIEAKVDKAVKEAEEVITKLTSRVETLEVKATDDTAVIEGLEATKSELEAELASKKEEVVDLTDKLAKLEERATSAESIIENLEKDKLMEARLSELTELKIARKEEAFEDQKKLVREMTDEEFASYRDGLSALREEFLASAREEEASALSDTATSESEEGEGVKDEDGVVTAPMDVPGALESAKIAMPRSDDVVEPKKKWNVFEKGLASMLIEQRGDTSKNDKE